ESLSAKLRTSAEFAKAARRMSQADSARLGGAIGCLDDADGPDLDALKAAVKDLAPGKVSSVIATSAGPTLLFVEDRVTEQNRAALVGAFVKLREATTALAKTAAEDFAKKLIERLEAGEAAEAATTAAIAALLPDEKDPGRLAADRPLSDISRPFPIEQS